MGFSFSLFFFWSFYQTDIELSLDEVTNKNLILEGLNNIDRELQGILTITTFCTFHCQYVCVCVECLCSEFYEIVGNFFPIKGTPKSILAKISILFKGKYNSIRSIRKNNDLSKYVKFVFHYQNIHFKYSDKKLLIDIRVFRGHHSV